MREKAQRGYEVFGGGGGALITPVGRKAIPKPCSKSAWLFSGPGALHAQALVHVPAHC